MILIVAVIMNFVFLQKNYYIYNIHIQSYSKNFKSQSFSGTIFFPIFFYLSRTIFVMRFIKLDKKFIS